MSAIDDLANKVQQLRDQLAAAETSLRNAQVDASDIKVGDKYKDRKGRVAVVVGMRVRYGKVEGVLGLVKKDGSVGERRSDTERTWEGWTKCS